MAFTFPEVDHATADDQYEGLTSSWGNRSSDETDAGGEFDIQLGAESLDPRSPVGRKGRIRQGDLLMFTSQLAIMCRSGVDLAESLREATRSCNHARLRPILQQIYAEVSNGSSVSAAMRRHEHVFGGAYLGSIAAAESSGEVPDVLDRLAALLRNQIRLRSSLISSISYPVALVGISSLVILALVFFVLPQFGSVFENMNKTPPPFTKALLDAAAFARGNMGALALGAVLATIAAVHFSRQPVARQAWDNAVLNFPLTRRSFRSLFAGRSFRLLGTILESGVPLLESVRLCRETVNNTLFRQLFDSMERDILNGSGITDTVARADFLPIGIGQMVATAERSGNLGQVLEMAGEFFEEEGERQIRQLVKLLEPVIILLMGVIVAVVVASVMLPLLNVTTMSH